MQWHVFNQRILGLVRPSIALAATSHSDNGQPLFRQTGCFCSLLATFFGPRDELLARALSWRGWAVGEPTIDDRRRAIQHP